MKQKIKIKRERERERERETRSGFLLFGIHDWEGLICEELDRDRTGLTGLYVETRPVGLFGTRKRAIQRERERERERETEKERQNKRKFRRKRKEKNQIRKL